jgi:hypothetical protein
VHPHGGALGVEERASYLAIDGSGAGGDCLAAGVCETPVEGAIRGRHCTSVQ